MLSCQGLCLAAICHEMKTLVIIGALVAVSIGAWYLFVNKKPIRAQSVAVIPFKSTKDESKQDLLIDGITEGILNSLSQQEGIKVSARSSSFKFRGNEDDLAEIRRKLGVEAVLVGSVLIDGDHVQIEVQLINTEDKMGLWSEEYNGKVEDIFALQDEIANSIAEAMSLSGRAAKTQRTASREAYELYLQGRSHWNLRSQADLYKGIEMFESAIEKDPQYGAAYAGISDCYTALGYSSVLSPKEAFPKAFEAASKALSLDSTLAEAHATLGYYKFYYEWDWAEAEQEFRKALSLNPNHALVYDWYGYYLTAMKRYDEAQAVFAKAISLDPLSAGLNTDMGFTYYYNNQFDQAATSLKAALELNPKYPLGHLWMGRVYQAKKMYAEAINEYKMGMEATPRWPVAFAQIGNVYGVSGDKEQAKSILDSLNVMANDRYVTSYGRALIYAGLGDKDMVFQWLNKAYEERSHWLVWLRSDPRWDPYRTEKQFAELEAKISLPDSKN